jgi:hypothetical protein
VEWTVHFKNTSEKDTPILSEIRALDVNQAVPAEATTVLHHNKGSRAAPNDFEPYEMGLPMRTEATFRSAGGRPTNGSWPYFNVNWGDYGLIVAMGWPGQWTTQFERDGAGGLAIRGGQLRIDTCASGGRRLDLETLRRSVPLVRSDCLFEPTGQQGHTYGISMWLPYHGTGTLVGKSAIGLNTDEGVREYDFRSHMAVTLTTAWDMRDKNLDYDKLRRLTAKFMKIAPLYMVDYYPITPHTLSPANWIAWQFNDPEKGIAMVQSFRREQSTQCRDAAQAPRA